MALLNGTSTGNDARPPRKPRLHMPAAHDGFSDRGELHISYLEMVRFFWWCLAMMAGQWWRDLTAWQSNFLSTPFSSDIFSHFVMLPLARKDPRLVASGPAERVNLRQIGNVLAHHIDDLTNLERLPTIQLINCASNNYGGFANLEPGASALLEKSLQDLPFAPGPAGLEELVGRECKDYMGFGGCAFAPSGFSANMLAFKIIFNAAVAQGRPCIFLCDRECHSSMWTGAYSNKGAVTLKFGHNDLTDLDRKLRRTRKSWPDAMICVAIEGTYSMEGSVPPIPAILALKKAYAFKLLVDEAHSFFALGSMGRGSFNYWQDQGFDCPLSEADVMTCMFSKSIGCTGGAVLANRGFVRQLHEQSLSLSNSGSERLATIVLVRVLHLLRKPQLIRHRMRMLREKSLYAASRLASAGCKLLSSPGNAIICFPVGSLRVISSLFREIMNNRVAVSPGTPPATPLWGCRIRVSIFATTSWVDLDAALVRIASACARQGISDVRALEPDLGIGVMDRWENTREAAAIRDESARVDQQAGELVDSLRTQISNKSDVTVYPAQHPEVMKAAVSALRKYGVGPCSARHYYGTFDVFMELEKRLAGLYPCLVKQAGQCAAIVCGDAQVTIGSAVAARALAPWRKKVYTTVLLPSSAPAFVTDAVDAVKGSSRCTVLFFDSPNDIMDILAEQKKKNHGSSCYLTLHLQAFEDGVMLEIIPVLRALSALSPAELAGVTILIDDSDGLGRLGPRKLGYLDMLEHLHGESVLTKATGARASSFQILVVGSWYHAFGHQGGYILGPAPAIHSLSFQARAYVFSTPPMPLQTVMSSKALEILQKTSGRRDSGVAG